MTLIQLEVAATRKSQWLWRLNTGSLNGLRIDIITKFLAICRQKYPVKIGQPYDGICPLGVFFCQTDLDICKCLITIYNVCRVNSKYQGIAWHVKLGSLVMIWSDCLTKWHNWKVKDGIFDTRVLRGWRISMTLTCPLSQPKMNPPGMAQTEWT